jgi:hypothetical protein
VSGRATSRRRRRECHHDKGLHFPETAAGAGPGAHGVGAPLPLRTR